MLFQNSYFTISIFSILLGIILLCVINFYNSRSNKINFLEKNKNLIFIKLYNELYKYNFIRKQILSIKYKLNLINDFNEKELNIKCIKIFILKNIIIFLFSILLICYINEIYIILFVLIILIYLVELTFDYYFSKIKIKLLYEMIECNDILIKKYLESKMVDLAIYDTLQELRLYNYNNILIQMNIIYNIIIDLNSEIKLKEYYIKAPNGYLKLLAGISFIVNDIGDVFENEKSKYVKCILDISKEIKEEILFKERINLALKSLNFIIIIPLFLMNPIKEWLSNSFYPIKIFYNSENGFLCKILVIFTVIISFIILNNIQNTDNELSYNGNKKYLNKIYFKYKKFIDIFIPSENTIKYKKILYKLKKSMYLEKIEIYYTTKILIMLSSFIFLLFISLTFNKYKSVAILNKIEYENFYANSINSQKLEELLIYEKQIIKTLYKKYKEDICIDDINLEVKKIEDRLKNKVDLEKFGLKILDKYKSYLNNKINYKYFILIYLYTIFSYFFLDIYLGIKSKIIKIDEEKEIMSFYVIISILINIKSVEVLDILEWLELFSHIFKYEIRKCIIEYDSGAEYALLRLKNFSNNYEFKKIVDNLINSINNLSITQAFSSLTEQKEYFYERRKNSNMKTIEYKINYGKIVGFAPFYIFLIIYFVLPLSLSSINELNLYMNLLYR